MKKHWTQTAAGRKKVAIFMKKSWAKRKRRAILGTTSNSQDISTTVYFPTNGSLSTRLKAADTIEQLNEIKSFLDLRDELLARLP